MKDTWPVYINRELSIKIIVIPHLCIVFQLWTTTVEYNKKEVHSITVIIMMRIIIITLFLIIIFKWKKLKRRRFGFLFINHYSHSVLGSNQETPVEKKSIVSKLRVCVRVRACAFEWRCAFACSRARVGKFRLQLGRYRVSAYFTRDTLRNAVQSFGLPFLYNVVFELLKLPCTLLLRFNYLLVTHARVLHMNIVDMYFQANK